MYVKRNVHAHNNFTIQYLHFLSLRNASWASKTIVGSKFASFERATHKLLIYRALQLLRLKMCNNVVHKNSTLQCKTSTITMQMWSFYTPNGVHLTCNCSPFAMQKGYKWRKTWCSRQCEPIKTATGISIIDFWFVTVFYCLDYICIGYKKNKNNIAYSMRVKQCCSCHYL